MRRFGDRRRPDPGRLSRSVLRRGEGAAVAEDEPREVLADAAVSRGIGVDRFGQRDLGVVRLAVEVVAVEVVQVRFAGRPICPTASASTPRTTVRVRRPAVRSAGSPVALTRRVPPSRSGARKPGVSSWAEQGRGDDQQRCGRIPLADGVEEAVDGCGEDAQTQRVGVDGVDADQTFGGIRVARAVNGSNSALPPNPRLTISPAARRPASGRMRGLLDDQHETSPGHPHHPDGPRSRLLIATTFFDRTDTRRRLRSGSVCPSARTDGTWRKRLTESGAFPE